MLGSEANQPRRGVSGKRPLFAVMFAGRLERRGGFPFYIKQAVAGGCWLLWRVKVCIRESPLDISSYKLLSIVSSSDKLLP